MTQKSLQNKKKLKNIGWKKVIAFVNAIVLLHTVFIIWTD